MTAFFLCKCKKCKKDAEWPFYSPYLKPCHQLVSTLLLLQVCRLGGRASQKNSTRGVQSFFWNQQMTEPKIKRW